MLKTHAFRNHFGGSLLQLRICRRRRLNYRKLPSSDCNRHREHSTLSKTTDSGIALAADSGIYIVRHESALDISGYAQLPFGVRAALLICQSRQSWSFRTLNACEPNSVGNFSGGILRDFPPQKRCALVVNPSTNRARPRRLHVLACLRYWKVGHLENFVFKKSNDA